MMTKKNFSGKDSALNSFLPKGINALAITNLSWLCVNTQFSFMSDLSGQTLILGGGFTGLYTALHLSQNHYPGSVTLIDRQERFCFRPLLYEYFSTQMDNEQVRPRFEDLLQGRGINFIQDRIEGIDLEKKEVQTASGKAYFYDNLVIGLGSKTGYFGVPGAQKNTLPFRSAQDAIALDVQVLNCVEEAIRTEGKEERLALLTFVIVGGGPTGVELAATLADLVPHWYEELGGNPQEIRILLLNRSSQILKGDINDPLRDKAQEHLQKHPVAVEIKTGATVTEVYPKQVEYEQDGQTKVINAQTVLWTAGTAVNPLIKNLPVSAENKDKKGRLKVTPTLQLPEYPEVFAGGDCVVMEEESYPPTAQVAHQQGSAIARNLQALVEGKDPQPAHINILGTFMKMGIEDGIANIFNRFEITGRVGHLMRQGTYMNVLPIPKHNLNITGKWFNEEIFQQYLKPDSTQQAVKWVTGAVISAVVARKVVQSLREEV